MSDAAPSEIAATLGSPPGAKRVSLARLATGASFLLGLTYAIQIAVNHARVGGAPYGLATVLLDPGKHVFHLILFPVVVGVFVRTFPSYHLRTLKARDASTFRVVIAVFVLLLAGIGAWTFWDTQNTFTGKGRSALPRPTNFALTPLDNGVNFKDCGGAETVVLGASKGSTLHAMVLLDFSLRQKLSAAGASKAAEIYRCWRDRIQARNPGWWANVGPWGILDTASSVLGSLPVAFLVLYGAILALTADLLTKNGKPRWEWLHLFGWEVVLTVIMAAWIPLRLISSTYLQYGSVQWLEIVLSVIFLGVLVLLVALSWASAKRSRPMLLALGSVTTALGIALPVVGHLQQKWLLSALSEASLGLGVFAFYVIALVLALILYIVVKVMFDRLRQDAEA